MSIIKGKKVEFKGDFNGMPAIRYVKGRDEYVVRVPDVYTALRSVEGDTFGMEEVYISGSDLWRLIKFDKWYEREGVSLSEERGDLDDTTYLGISWVQARYYLSVSVLSEARRVNNRFSFSQWLPLKRRVARGGRPKGSRNKNIYGEEDIERIERMIEDYDRIVAHCVEKDWANEYVELEKEIAKYKGEKVPSRKALLEKFTELRKKDIE